MSYFPRSVMIANLHNYIKENLGPGGYIGENLSEELNIYTVLNHDSISRRKVNGVYEIKWSPVPPFYNPRWDIENLASIWSKVINDTLIELNYLQDDTVKFITGISYNFIPIDNFKDRRIEINFYRND